jgi:hypothetical protein
MQESYITQGWKGLQGQALLLIGPIQKFGRGVLDLKHLIKIARPWGVNTGSFLVLSVRNL